MKTTLFWDAFKQKDLQSAANTFIECDQKQQVEILSTLFQQSSHYSTPTIISILKRDLHDDKKFEDFHRAWLPPRHHCNPIKEGECHYLQYFNAPTRVINCVSVHNPSEIYSVGLTWVQTEEQKRQMMAITQGKAPMGNSERSNSINKVADKVGAAAIAITEADDHLGTPFGVELISKIHN